MAQDMDSGKTPVPANAPGGVGVRGPDKALPARTPAVPTQTIRDPKRYGTQGEPGTDPLGAREYESRGDREEREHPKTSQFSKPVWASSGRPPDPKKEKGEGIPVRAVMRGYYGVVYHDEGDVFAIRSKEDFSENWMEYCDKEGNTDSGTQFEEDRESRTGVPNRGETKRPGSVI